MNNWVYSCVSVFEVEESGMGLLDWTLVEGNIGVVVVFVVMLLLVIVGLLVVSTGCIVS